MPEVLFIMTVIRKESPKSEKIFIILFIALAVVLLAGVISSLLLKYSDAKPKPSAGTLIVNNKYTIADNVTIYYKENSSYNSLPLIEFLEILGADIEWIDEISANVTYKEKKYILNLNEVSLVEEGNSMNLILSADGWRREYTVLDRELLLDSVTVKCAFQFMGDRIYFRYDHDKSIVYVSVRSDSPF